MRIQLGGVVLLAVAFGGGYYVGRRRTLARHA
jgi:hypothetical protein